MESYGVMAVLLAGCALAACSATRHVEDVAPRMLTGDRRHRAKEIRLGMSGADVATVLELAQYRYQRQ